MLFVKKSDALVPCAVIVFFSGVLTIGTVHARVSSNIVGTVPILWGLSLSNNRKSIVCISACAGMTHVSFRITTDYSLRRLTYYYNTAISSIYYSVLPSRVIFVSSMYIFKTAGLPLAKDKLNSDTLINWESLSS